MRLAPLSASVLVLLGSWTWAGPVIAQPCADAGACPRGSICLPPTGACHLLPGWCLDDDDCASLSGSHCDATPPGHAAVDAAPADAAGLHDGDADGGSDAGGGSHGDEKGDARGEPGAALPRLCVWTDECLVDADCTTGFVCRPQGGQVCAGVGFLADPVCVDRGPRSCQPPLVPCSTTEQCSHGLVCGASPRAQCRTGGTEGQACVTDWQHFCEPPLGCPDSLHIMVNGQCVLFEIPPNSQTNTPPLSTAEADAGEPGATPAATMTPHAAGCGCAVATAAPSSSNDLRGACQLIAVMGVVFLRRRRR